MASASGKKTSASRKKSSQANKDRKQAQRVTDEQDSALFHEIGLIILFVVMAILFFCNFGLIGPVGNYISGMLFGLFGFTAYIAPVLLFLAMAFWFANEGNPNAVRKMVAGGVLFVILGVVCDMIAKNAVSMESYQIKALYESCRDGKMGGGVLAGSLAYLLNHYLGTIGTVLVVALCSIVSFILLTERSFISSVKSGSSRIREISREDSARRREQNQIRRQEQEEQRRRREEERRLRDEEKRLKVEEKENERILRMEKKVTGVMLDASLKKEEERRRDDMHEIILSEEFQEEPEYRQPQIMREEAEYRQPEAMQAEPLQQEEPRQWEEAGHWLEPAEDHAPQEHWQEPVSQKLPLPRAAEQIRIHREGAEDFPETQRTERMRPAAGSPKEREGGHGEMSAVHNDLQPPTKAMPQKYMFPPLSRLQKGAAVSSDSSQELKKTAMRLQQTLSTFGVRVTITDISQGPSVTRYELQPEQGVKVSKIVSLSDDIKLNLAATDIRIEAPIPGKAAVGIEVPNKENMVVALRDLLEAKEFKEFPSNLAFAVGKDIAGKVVVADIAKMPHVLIAGATGSGKSVCINTLIMSILYKAHPDDVKLIMVDPKVVELSVYNGIPHLLIPVVTDPKKASAALHWGVSEMEDRYRKFADFNVRDFKGYNTKLETMREKGEENVPAKLPQIVIIVDELADLMMVSPGEVEESICRLAQLARACGIHLVIATQRPSVDVITGLIKANMPSRIAFAVSSGVDSRTILDMVGAEKLLGKGDMLFYPQGYSKPARVQGAFVSDKEVSDVVDFLKNQSLGNVYADDIEEKIQNMGSSQGGAGGGPGGSQLDEYFAEAGRFIIEKDKASIGMLQRVLKIGFNRAARIMDQLCEYGVVGEEEGTKPRKVLMSEEQFEQLLEEI